MSLYHLRARYYNMLTGRFETMDPFQGRIFYPATLHKYIFTGNNPVNWADPSGRDTLEEYQEVPADAVERYPSKIARCEEHHIFPKYLGGNPNGPLAYIPAAYHQLITNAFRDAWAYGLGAPGSAAAQAILDAVYETYSLTFATLGCLQ
jgi:hypothetical protein